METTCMFSEKCVEYRNDSARGESQPGASVRQHTESSITSTQLGLELSGTPPTKTPPDQTPTTESHSEKSAKKLSEALPGAQKVDP